MKPDTLPDRKTCRTRPSDSELWECLVEKAKSCPFNLNLGAEYYCLHKDCNTFAECQQVRPFKLLMEWG